MALTTQTAKMREAANVIEAFENLERAIFKGPKDMTYQDVFSRHIRAAFPGDGTGAFIHADDTKHSRFSNHQRIQAVIWQNELNDTLAPLAESLYKLLPGQPLTWELEGAFQHISGRHHLYLGVETSSSISSNTVPPIIDTVISRWKAPLVRLSNYLDLDEETSPQQEWFFAADDKSNHAAGPVTMSSFTIVPAHNLQHALRQHSFKRSSHAAVRKPLEPRNAHAVLNTKSYNFTRLIKKVETELKDREESVRADHSTLLGIAKEIHQNMTALTTQVKARLAINLKEGTHRFIFNQHPFAQTQDVEDEQERQRHLEALGKEFSALLCDTVKTIYPNLQNGSLVVEVAKTNNLKNNNPVWTFQIDGFRHDAPYGDITALLNVAHSMHLHQTGELDTAYGATSKRDEHLDVNHDKNMVIIFANSPEHAALTYIGKRNVHNVSSNSSLRLLKLEAPRLQKHADEKEECLERMNKYYK
mgnify:CR=1 FL=1